MKILWWLAVVVVLVQSNGRAIHLEDGTNNEKVYNGKVNDEYGGLRAVHFNQLPSVLGHAGYGFSKVKFRSSTDRNGQKKSSSSFNKLYNDYGFDESDELPFSEDDFSPLFPSDDILPSGRAYKQTIGKMLEHFGDSFESSGEGEPLKSGKALSMEASFGRLDEGGTDFQKALIMPIKSRRRDGSALIYNELASTGSPSGELYEKPVKSFKKRTTRRDMLFNVAMNRNDYNEHSETGGRYYNGEPALKTCRGECLYHCNDGMLHAETFVKKNPYRESQFDNGLRANGFRRRQEKIYKNPETNKGNAVLCFLDDENGETGLTQAMQRSLLNAYSSGRCFSVKISKSRDAVPTRSLYAYKRRPLMQDVDVLLMHDEKRKDGIWKTSEKQDNVGSGYVRQKVELHQPELTAIMASMKGPVVLAGISNSQIQSVHRGLSRVMDPTVPESEDKLLNGTGEMTTSGSRKENNTATSTENSNSYSNTPFAPVWTFNEKRWLDFADDLMKARLQ